MATLKHINSKNADYGAAEQYLLFEHDEFTMKPVLDETGRLIPREDYRLSTLNCDGEDFAVACMRCKSQYKNAGFGQNKNVGFPTFLFCLFNHHQSLAEADLLVCRKDH